MESSCVSAYNTIQPSYMMEAPSTLSASVYFDCDDYPSPNLNNTDWGNLIPSITVSLCNTPMETGSQQTRSAWDVDRTGVEASKSAAYQSRNGLPYYRPMRPMTTYDANMPLQSTTNVNPITQVYDQNKRQNQTNAPLFNNTPSNAPYVYDVLSPWKQNIPDSLCNTPMETGSQQTRSAWGVDRTGVEASKSAAYQSRNGLPYYRPMRPMTTYDANMPLQSTTNVNPSTQVYDQNKRQNQTNAPLFNNTPSNAPYVYDVLSPWKQNIPDSLCNTPMETGSQQTRSAWGVDRTGVEASKSAAYQSRNGLPYYRPMRPMTTYDANMPLQSTTNVNPITQMYDQNKRQNQTNAPLFNNTPSNAPYVYDVLSPWEQNIPDLLCNTPMETGSQQEQVVAKDEDPEFKKLSDQLLEWEDELLDLEDKKRKRESMYKTEEVNVYGSKLSSLGQNIPDSLCNTPMETGSQQTSSAWDVDCTGVEASKSAAYQSMNVLHDDTPITTDSQQKQMETKGHQRAKQLKETYNHALPTIGMELPLHSFYSSMKIAPCLGECKRTPNVSVLHDTNCVLYNMPLLQELQNKNPKVLQQVKEHLTNINMDRDGFKNLLFHEKLSKMLDKIECAVKYIKHCSAKYLHLLTFKSQINSYIPFKSQFTLGLQGVVNLLQKKIADFDELIHDLMQKDMSYYQLKVDINNMLEIMSHHKYAEMVESYYHLLALESRINTFIENYKKVSESVKEKLDIQNNNPDFASNYWYDKYNAYINELINNLDADNSFLDNNSVFVAAPIISNPHLKLFYRNMHTVCARKFTREKPPRNTFKLPTQPKPALVYSVKQDLSIVLDALEDLHVRLNKILDILASNEQSDVIFKFKNRIKEARARILYSARDYSHHTYRYLSVKELGRIEISRDCSSSVMICMKLCMWLSLSRGEEACRTLKQEPRFSSLCNALGNKGHCLKEYIDYKKDLFNKLKEKWFPLL